MRLPSLCSQLSSPNCGNHSLGKYTDDEQGHTYPAPAPLEKGTPVALAAVAASKRRRRRWIIVGVGLLIVVIAVGVGVGLAKHFSNNSKSTNSSGSGANQPGGGPTVPTESGSKAVLWGGGAENITVRLASHCSRAHTLKAFGCRR